MKDVRYSVFLALNHISDEAILEAELAPTGGAAAPIMGEIIHGGKDMEREDSSRRKRRAGVLLPFAGWIAAALGIVLTVGIMVALIRGGVLVNPFGPPPDTDTDTSTEQTTDEPAEEPVFEVWDGSVATHFASGQGTRTDPYIINKPAQLAYLAQLLKGKNSSYASKYYRLEANLDLNRYEWTPIGTEGGVFKGHFDGNSHIIRNVSLRQLSYTGSYHVAGLFGVINNATVEDLTVTDVVVHVKNVDSSKQKIYTGGLAGIIWVDEEKTVILSDCKLERVKLSVECTDSGSNYNFQGGVAGRINIEEDGQFTGSRLQAVDVELYGKYGKNIYQGMLTGYTECHAAFELNDVCLEGKVGHGYNSGNHLYAAVSGYFHSDGGKSACKNVFAVCDNSDRTGRVFTREVKTDLSTNPTFSFENCFMGYTEGNLPTSVGLLYYGDGEGITYRNCLYTTFLPEKHYFNEQVWDVSDRRHPRLR